MNYIYKQHKNCQQVRPTGRKYFYFFKCLLDGKQFIKDGLLLLYSECSSLYLLLISTTLKFTFSNIPAILFLYVNLPFVFYCIATYLTFKFQMIPLHVGSIIKDSSNIPLSLPLILYTAFPPDSQKNPLTSQ